MTREEAELLAKKYVMESDIAMREYRAAIIEECARAIDEAALEADNHGWTACDYAGYLRALKDKP